MDGDEAESGSASPQPRRATRTQRREMQRLLDRVYKKRRSDETRARAAHPSRLTEFSTLIPLPDLPAVDRSTLRDIQRGEHADALVALEELVLTTVEDLLRPILNNAMEATGFRSVTAAGDEILSLDALASIVSDWNGALPALMDVVGQVYGAGQYATCVRLGANLENLGAGPIFDERALVYIEQSQNRLVGVGDEIYNTIRSGLAEGFSRAEGITELSARVQETLESSMSRANTIARTETLGAANAGQHETQKVLAEFEWFDGSTGEPVTFAGGLKQWLSTSDGFTRRSHVEADGQTVALNETFEVGGDSLEYPGDSDGSAAEVINCRCTVLFVDDPNETDMSNRQSLGDSETSSFEEAAADAAELLEASATVGHTEQTRSETVGQNMAEQTVRLSGRTISVLVPESMSLEMTARAIQQLVDQQMYPTDEDAAPRPATPMKSAESIPTDRPETWHALLVVEGVPTGDRRFIEEGALTWRDLPLPIMWQTEQPETGGHAHSVHVAQATRLERDGNEIHAWGYHLESQPEGLAWYASLIESGRHGLSVDMDDADVELDMPLAEENGDPFDSLLAEPLLARFTKARLMGATDVPFPAFSESFIEPIESVPTVANVDLVVASALMSVDAPPLAHFANPHLPFGTPTTITAEGRVFGHLALWGTCHTGFADTCVTPPNEADHSFFTTGEIETAEGDRVAVGQITLGTGHAGRELSGQAAARHYDHTGSAVADVATGSDAFGIWFSGSLRSGVTAEEVRVLRASALSGDWRRIGGALRLVAALAVNVPGFPIPRTSTGIYGGVQASLVAAGVVSPLSAESRSTGSRRDPARVRLAERIARTIGRSMSDRVAAATKRVHGGRITEMACGSCGGRSAVNDLSASASSVTMYEVRSPSGETTQYPTLLSARKAARAVGGTLKVL